MKVYAAVGFGKYYTSGRVQFWPKYIFMYTYTHTSVTGGHKNVDLLFQVGGCMQDWQPCSVKKNIFAKSKEVKTEWSNSDMSGRIF
jgi:hypothetical protein